MNTVIIVNLNGIAFHLEEPGYQTLRNYLDRAQAQLSANPDKSEIMSDLEQAIADKCSHFLSPHKNVLTADEVDTVVKQMGPVQSEGTASSNGTANSDGAPRPDGGAQSGDGTASDPGSAQQAGASKNASQGPSVRRLYQIREGAMISGVCTGIAAYLDVDVTVVRILFALFAVLTYGLGVTVYIAMMLVIPFANTSEEHAAASGAPFNAQQVIDRAKKHYAEFKDSKEWRQHWREQRREWRRKWRTERIWWGTNFQRNVYHFRTGTGYAGQIIAGLMLPVLAIGSTLLGCAMIAAIVILATTGSLLGWQTTEHMPLWAALLILVIVFTALNSPFRHARKAIYYNQGAYNLFWFTAWYELISLAFFGLICWLAYTHVPEVHEFFQNFLENMQAMWNNILNSLRHSARHVTAIRPLAQLI
jgi:phage shock protein PspC (stress-responsive transcriptional regulator)